MHPSVPPTPSTPHRTLAFAALAIAGSVWGTGFLFCKIALTQLSVGHMLFYRLLFALVGFLPLVFIYPVHFRAKDWGQLLLASFLGIPCMFLIQFEGLARTTVSQAALMVGTAPVMLVLGAALIFREKIGLTVWLSLAASTLGVLLVLHPNSATPTTTVTDTPSVIGDLLVIASLVGGTGWVLISKHLTKRYPPIALTTTTWFALIGAGLLSTVLTTLLWNWGLTHVQASHAAIFLNFEPIIGATLGVLLLHEPFGIWTVVGGTLIVGAAAVISWKTA
ncbi:MAG TPA: EamA family transporter [Gemmatimonadaceae bacterium]|nr:EamA family transporter [Gemmatimonadaceae bacterium]